MLMILLLVAGVARADDDVKTQLAQARDAHDRQDFAAAIPQLEAIIDKFPNDALADPAGELLLDSLAQQRDFEKLETAARKLKPLPAFKAREHQGQLALVIGQAMRARAEDLETRKQFDQAAEMYMRIAAEFPKDAQLDEMLYNAGVSFEQARDIEAAVAALRQVADKAPKSRLAQRALVRAARIDEVWRPERSAEEYIRASALGCEQRPKFPSECLETAAARYNAALMFAAIGDNAKALAAFATYVNDFPKGMELDSAMFFVGEIAKRMGNDARAVKAFEAYLTVRNRAHVAKAALELAQLHLKLGNREEQSLYIAESMAKYRKRPELEAEAWFELGEMHLSAAETLPPAAPERAREMTAVLALYTQAVAVGDPYWVVAALDRSARAMDTQQQEISAYRKALSKAETLGVVGDYVRDARKQLERLEPETTKAGHESREGFRDHAFWPELVELDATHR